MTTKQLSNARSVFRPLSTLVSAVVIALTGCGADAGNSSVVPSVQSLVSFDEVVSESSHWFTLVLASPTVPKGLAEDQMTAQLRRNGADEIVWLNEIGVAFAHFKNPDDAYALKGVKLASSSVSTVAQMRTYGVPGAPTPGELRKFGKNARVSRPTLLAPKLDVTDSLFQSTWGIHRVKADKAWATTTGSHKTVVAVVDTGIATNHPDLAPNIVHTSCNTWSKLRGKSCETNYPTTHWHGTHVAGTIAAAFGGGQTVGIGPNLGLASYKVFENMPQTDDFDGDGTRETLMFSMGVDANILGAVIDATNRGFQVINLSLGSVWVTNPGEEIPSLTAWSRAAQYAASKGTVLVVSAGNFGDFAVPEVGLLGNLDNPQVTGVPAEANGPGILTVGATGIRPAPIYPQPGNVDVRAFYSSFGSAVDIAAPGGDNGAGQVPDARYQVLSSSIALDPFLDSYMAWQLGLPYTPAEPQCALDGNCAPIYHGAVGTSMAAPHVAGALGLLVDRGVRGPAAAEMLKQSADKTALSPALNIGNLLDVQAAVQMTKRQP